MFQSNKKKSFVIILLVVVSVITISFTAALQPRFKNLKILSPNLTNEEMDDVMDGFKSDLGVRCNYCHAPSKTQQGKMDMVSDDNPKKEITRSMLRMTNEMNQKFISQLPHADTAKIQLITCNTCHRGKAKPVIAK